MCWGCREDSQTESGCGLLILRVVRAGENGASYCLVVGGEIA